MALQGTLDTFALPDVLRLLAATRKTGRLRLTGTRGAGSLWVEDGAISTVEATHAPHATAPVDALFELLRFEDGSFTFDADARPDGGGERHDVESILQDAEALLAEWREIEAVVPSLDAWVTLRHNLPEPEVTIDQARWTTLVAVGSGATVRRIGEELCLPELPVSRAVRDLVTSGLVDLAPVAPAGPVPASEPTTVAADPDPEPGPWAEIAGAPAGVDEPEAEAEATAAAPSAEGPSWDEDGIPAARPIRARRARPRVRDARSSDEPERFVPLELPTQPIPTYDPAPADEAGEVDEAPAATEDGTDVDELAAAFPGLAGRTEPADAGDGATDGAAAADDEELARQLATLSPRAAEAVRAAAAATSDEERDAALDEIADGEEGPINRGLLLRFLSSVKS